MPKKVTLHNIRSFNKRYPKGTAGQFATYMNVLQSIQDL